MSRGVWSTPARKQPGNPWRDAAASFTKPSYQTADGAFGRSDLANSESYGRVGELSCNAIRRDPDMRS
jgi:hypothetical protein